jgi:NH3-dependent NAD+ synthetase
LRRKVIVGFSGGVSSAWCAGWATRTYPKDEIVLLWHDTKEEHPDTVRFVHEMAAALGLPVTEWSDGRSVTEVFRDEGFARDLPFRTLSRARRKSTRDVAFDLALYVPRMYIQPMNNAATKKPSAKSIRNEEARRRALPIEAWLAEVGFTPDEVAAMGGEDIARKMRA